MRRPLLLVAAIAGVAALAWAGWRQPPQRVRKPRAAERPAERRVAEQRAAATAGDGRGARLARAEVTGRLARKSLRESSGAAASLAHPGVLYTINDSGNDPTLYATDVTGADRGAWRIRGADNVDWEAVAVGPCGAAPGAPAAPDAPRCVYVGDVGDNDARHPARVLYRVPEPDVAARDARDRGRGALEGERLTYAYRDGAQDVEAMWVAADGAVHLVTKRPRRAPDGRLRPALVYRLPAGAWTRRTTQRAPAVAELVDSLPAIVPGSAALRVVTDAAPSPDGRWLAVRSYWQLWVFALDPRTGRPRRDAAAPAPRLCDLSPLGEEQGEGLAWLPRGAPGAGAGDALALTSEGERAPIHVVACDAPRGR